MIGKRPFLLALQDSEPIACLACPPDPPGIAWLRLFSVAPNAPVDELWRYLWDQAEVQVREASVRQTMVLVTEKWMTPVLKRSGFEPTNSVDFLVWQGGELPKLQRKSGVMRDMQPSDLAFVTEIDNHAFEEIWRYTYENLENALERASLASVMEIEGRVVAYLMASASALGAHIARLAVAPAWQNRGIGRALVHHALVIFTKHGFSNPTVNTQSDNHAAQRLYRSLGFRKTEQTVPVFGKDLLQP
jgi:ribosomal-protein-alanine N-acetyltransferase